MFQQKIDKIFKDMLNIFGIADDILVMGYNDDGTDHNEMVCSVLTKKLISDQIKILDAHPFHSSEK